MVQVTKGKNVVIETYDAEFKEFTATAAQTDFTMVNKAGETTPEYTRVYVDNVELASTDITVSSATPAVVAIPACTVGTVGQISHEKLNILEF
jgi:2-methylaconitate cis-trans-isomerase PrpF